MTNEKLAELRKLLADASPGPWRILADTYTEDGCNSDGEFVELEFTQGWNILDGNGVEVVGCEGILAHHKDRAALIVALRNNAADMLDEIERLRGALRPFAKAGKLVADSGSGGDFWAYRPAGGDEYGIAGDHLLNARAALGDAQ